MKSKLSIFLVVSLLLTSLLVGGCGSKQSGEPQQGNQPASSVDQGSVEQAGFEQADEGTDFSVEIIGRSGTSKIVQLSDFTAVTGQGGIKKTTGTIISPASITGVRLTDVLEGEGGIQPEDTLEFIAGDGYVATLSGEQVLGDVVVYGENGEVRTDAPKIDAVLMVSSENGELAEGLPRVAFVAETDVITDGFQWAKEVVTIKITGASPAADSSDNTGSTKQFDVQWTVAVQGADKSSVSNADVDGLPVVDVSAVMKKKDGTELEQVWTGILMKDLLEYLGASAAGELIVEAGDGYNKTYTQDIFSSEGAVLAWAADGELLDEGSGPVQFVIAGQSANMWIKQTAVIKIQ